MSRGKLQKTCDLLLVQRLAHAAAVVLHDRALHHELDLTVDERGAALADQ